MLFVIGTFVICLIIFLGLYLKWFMNLEDYMSVTFKKIFLGVIFICSACISFFFMFGTLSISMRENHWVFSPVDESN